MSDKKKDDKKKKGEGDDDDWDGFIDPPELPPQKHRHESDYMNFNEENDILNIINEESIYYSGEINKITRSGKIEERFALITNVNFYNIEKGMFSYKSRRTANLRKIEGVTCSS